MAAHDIFSRAESIKRTIARKEIDVAVFAQRTHEGIVFRTCRVKGELWNRAIKDNDYVHGPIKLVGVYNSKCKSDWILEDLEHVQRVMTYAE
jgi:hypothetical protein